MPETLQEIEALNEQTTAANRRFDRARVNDLKAFTSSPEFVAFQERLAELVADNRSSSDIRSQLSFVSSSIGQLAQFASMKESELDRAANATTP